MKGLFSPPEGTLLLRYAAAVGMIWGVFLGAGVMGFSLLLVTALQVARIIKKKPDQIANLDPKETARIFVIATGRITIYEHSGL